MFRASDALDLHALESAVVAGAPDLAQPRGSVELARAQVEQMRLWENPGLNASWNTLPVGATNPTNLSHPYANVPNYAIQLSYGIPVAKRGPRIRSAQAGAQAAQSALRARTRELALELARALGVLAAATLRMEGLSALVEDALHDVDASRARLSATFGTPLEVDRLSLEADRAQQQLLAAESMAVRALAECATLVGTPCEGFADARQARMFFERWLGPTPDSKLVASSRHDLVALEQLETSHREAATLARASRWPDPLVYAGYVHDRFVISGNQRNSLNVGVGLAIPIFDRGQARVAAANSQASAARAERALRIHAAQATIPHLERELETQRTRQRQLTQIILTRANPIVDQLEAAVQSRLVPLGDLIQARRTLNELMLEEAESYAEAFGALLDLLAQTGAPR